MKKNTKFSTFVKSSSTEAEGFRILIVYPTIPMMLVTPLAIAIFTWILRKDGFEVDLFDSTQYADGDSSSPQNRAKFLQARNLFAKQNLEFHEQNQLDHDFRQKIESFKPNLLLYSFTEDSLGRALQMLRISNSYHIPTIVGGVLATADPEWLISLPEISILGVGEGEEVVREVALLLSQNKSIESVANLWIKLPGGRIIRNPERPYVHLDNYSADFSLFDESRFMRPMGGKIHRALPIETYRGCPYRCTFCNSPMHNYAANRDHRVYIRRCSIDTVRLKIKQLIESHKVNLLYFVDDSFLARPRKELEQFMEMYAEFRIPFWFNTRPENCNPELLNRLREVGLFRVSFGVESGNERFRKEVLERNISNKDLIRYFNMINDAGIQFSINYIIGFPFETRELIFDTISFAKQIKGYDSLTVSVFTPYRGTVLRKRAIKEGWLDPEARTVHTTASSLLNMPHLTPRQIDGLMRTFLLYVEFNKACYPEIEKIERFELGSEEILKKYTQLYQERRWGKVGGLTS
jgi:radical SAM superfamily enzyme YgiQ (UPF0313 family)